MIYHDIPAHLNMEPQVNTMPNIDNPLSQLWTTPKPNSPKSNGPTNMFQPTWISKPQQGHGTLDTAYPFQPFKTLYWSQSRTVAWAILDTLPTNFIRVFFPAVISDWLNKSALFVFEWFQTVSLTAGTLFPRRSCGVVQSTCYLGETIHYSGGNARNSGGTVNFQPILVYSGANHDNLPRIDNTLGRKYRHIAISALIQDSRDRRNHWTLPGTWCLPTLVTCWIILGRCCVCVCASTGIDNIDS